MSDIWVVDTHALLWFLAGDRRLSRRASQILIGAQEGNADVAIPAIVLAEALGVIEKRQVGTTMAEILRMIEEAPGLHVAPFDAAVVRALLTVPPSLSLHDRVIAATAVVYGAKVITRDPELTRAVETTW